MRQQPEQSAQAFIYRVCVTGKPLAPDFPDIRKIIPVHKIPPSLSCIAAHSGTAVVNWLMLKTDAFGRQPLPGCWEGASRAVRETADRETCNCGPTGQNPGWRSSTGSQIKIGRASCRERGEAW